MLVTLDQSLFLDSHCDETVLINIMKLGRLRRLRLRCKPAYRIDGNEPVNNWLRKFGDAHNRITYENLEAGLQNGLSEWDYEPHPQLPELQVILEKRSDIVWPGDRTKPIRMPPNDHAEEFLRTPLLVFLEDGTSDWAFLKKLVPEEWKDRFYDAEKHKRLKPDHRGGIPQLRTWLENHVTTQPANRLRSFTVFDSDAISAGDREESSRRAKNTAAKKDRESERAEEICIVHSIPYHRLARRMTENYIPESGLHDWSCRGSNAAQTDQRKHLVRAFLAKAKIERYYEHKDYFKTGGGLDCFWKDESFQLRSADVHNDGSFSELSELFCKLLAVV